MAALLRLSRAIDKLNEAVGRTAAWAIVAAILISALNAFTRKLFGLSSNAWLEAQWYLFGATFMLCAPWTLASNEHIRIDLISNRLSPRGRSFVEMFGHVFFLFPFAALMTYLSWPFFFSSFRSGEMSVSAGGLIIWPAKAVILVGFALLLLQWASEAIKRVAIMRGLLPETLGGGHAAGAEAEAERLIAATAGEGQPPAARPPVLQG